jgi:hypothetical protein
MNVIFAGIQMLYWACVGIGVFIMSILGLALGLFAAVGRLTWWLLFENAQVRSVSAGPQRTKFKQ